LCGISKKEQKNNVKKEGKKKTTLQYLGRKEEKANKKASVKSLCIRDPRLSPV